MNDEYPKCTLYKLYVYKNINQEQCKLTPKVKHLVLVTLAESWKSDLKPLIYLSESDRERDNTLT